MNIDPHTLEVFIESMIHQLLEMFNKLPPSVRDQIRAEWQAVMAALTALRGVIGQPGQITAMQTLLQALRALAARLAAAGVAVPGLITDAVALLEAQLGALGAVAVEALFVLALILIAIMAWIKAVNEIIEARGPVAPPVGGPLCGGGAPVARGRSVSSWSLWGEHRAFKFAEEKARADAQSIPCPGNKCLAGSCRGNCAITDIVYAYRVLWTVCTLNYDVYCECY